MPILTLNAGSSSVKFTLFASGSETILATGLVERIGSEGTRLSYRRQAGGSLRVPMPAANADEAVGAILGALTDGSHGVLAHIGEIQAAGHRVVHGGEHLTRPVVVDPGVKSIIAECARIAPLHNPPNLEGIEACERRIPHAVQVAVFDTAFHASLPAHAFHYGIPNRYYEEARIRRYGFHGISHKFVSEEAVRFLGRTAEGLRLITCHLGNGCSITAVKDGKSIDTSMGFTPLEGLIMGTRCGDIDPAAVLFLMEHYRLDLAATNDLLNKQSGILGLAGIGSNDLRDVMAACEAGNPHAALALETFSYRIKKYIGAYAAAMGGLDALVFTAGIGENSAEVRRRVCAGLDSPEGFAIVLDPAKNAAAERRTRAIHAAASRVKVLVVPTNEELEILRETLGLLTRR